VVHSRIQLEINHPLFKAAQVLVTVKQRRHTEWLFLVEKKWC